MNDAPLPESEPRNLRFLRLLVTVLTATMIFGLLTIVALFVSFPGGSAPVPLPEAITLPDGSTAAAFTRGPDWYAIVTTDDEILIYDAAKNTLRQRVKINEQ